MTDTVLAEYLDVCEAHANELIARRTITQTAQLRISMAVLEILIKRNEALHAQLLGSGYTQAQLDAAYNERCASILGKTFVRADKVQS